MGDRAFILIIIALIALGIYSYQQALHERGGITPLRELLGVSSKQEDDKGTVTDKLNAFDLKQDFRKLQEQFNASDAQKDQLLNNQDTHIKALLRQNDKLTHQTKDFIQLALGKLEALKNQSKNLRTLEEAVINLVQVSDPLERQLTFEKHQTQIINLVNSMVQNPDEELNLINKILLETNEMLSTKFDAVRWGCSDLEVCLRENMAAVDNQVQFYLDSKIIGPLRQLKDINELSQILDHEYKFLMSNTQGSDKAIESNNEHLQERMERLIDRLDTLNIDDLGAAARLIERLQAEQDSVVANLVEHHKLLEARFNEAKTVMRGIMQRLGQSRVFDFKPLITGYTQQEEDEREVFELLRAESQLYINLLARSLEENRIILDSIAKHINVDLAALKEELGIVKMTDSFHRITQPPPQPELMQRDAPRMEMRQPSVTTNEQMKRMREKVHRDEETLKNLLNVYGK